MEHYGDAPKVTSEALREETGSQIRLALGVPGSLSNRPVAVAATPPSGAPPKDSVSSAQKSASVAPVRL